MEEHNRNNHKYTPEWKWQWTKFAVRDHALQEVLVWTHQDNQKKCRPGRICSSRGWRNRNHKKEEKERDKKKKKLQVYQVIINSCECPQSRQDQRVGFIQALSSFKKQQKNKMQEFTVNYNRLNMAAVGDNVWNAKLTESLRSLRYKLMARTPGM